MNKPDIKQVFEYESDVFDLLLLADPSRKQVESYLGESNVYGAYIDNNLLGVYVLYPVNDGTAEIKNIAVNEDYHNKGIGTQMLYHAMNQAKELGYKEIIIGTGDVGDLQLYLYQKVGFKKYDVKKNFFIDNYDELMFENGKQLKDMVMLSFSII